ncbi:MAG: adenine deaminase [Ignavibacteriae bacterium HGW-Ignavibacteriae-1]|jgi:adenine deaminase|nr:MAG: adenine deaminase [Ignavibacteriae bacterium HGW-Ignavibacteriae-1]
MKSFELEGKIVDIHNERIFPGKVFVKNGIIEKIEEIEDSINLHYIMPGFVDAHVHIESSMIVPSEFARLAVVHGTVATVSDPHEIANVLGIEGIRFMIENGGKVPFKFNFGASSCVPATTFETAGATISADEIEQLLADDRIKYMSEMMNFPGVIYDFPDVMEKIKIAHASGKPIDGHAPGLRGDGLQKYASAGITTDHESFTYDEAKEKIEFGMKTLIREGTAAKNFEALHALISEHNDMVMFCSDDKHPDDLVLNHINKIASRAIAKGHDLFDVLRVSCVNPVTHYNLDVGLLREGDPADLVLVNNLTDFDVFRTYVDGVLTSENGKSLIERVEFANLNQFNCSPKSASDFEIKSNGKSNLNVIEALDGELITKRIVFPAKIENNLLLSDVENDVLKLTVVNRYEDVKPAVAFIRNFGLKRGAIASSVGHDSHNITAVGVDDESLAIAVNAVIKLKGGMVLYDGSETYEIPLPVAGLMSDGDGYIVAEQYATISRKARELGSPLHSPFMTLSFMALLVIPYIKLSDKGLFDGEKFEFKELQVL